MTERVVCWFSCGVASAIATILAHIKYPNAEAVYCRVKEEHEDNLRFIDDFERVMGIKVKIMMNEKYNGSIYETFRSSMFIKNQYGARCTTELKKNVRKQYQRPNDIQVLGFTVNELDRANRFIDANNEVNEDFILIENNITKKQCFSYLKHLGISLPIMYKLGYQNNNCVGCVKGGMGYWNAIRKDFPDTFEKMMLLEREIGHALCKDKNGPVYLDELDEDRGNFKKDSPLDCGFLCEVKS